MNLTQIYTVGDNPIELQGAIGPLQAMVMCPQHYRSDYVAVLGHPHSLQGGTMQNKVVTTLARTFRDLGIPSVRFNFRGVGSSVGKYDDGVGESDDVIAIVRQLQQRSPSLKICLAGFSFGSYVTFRAAKQLHPALLISIAPPITHYDFTHYVAHPWIIVQGEEDEVVPPQAVFDWYQQLQPNPILIRFPDTTHFFHGKLNDLKSGLIQEILRVLTLT